MSELDEHFKAEVFQKLDKLNDSLNTFKVTITEKIGALPCGEHREAIKGNRGKITLLATLFMVILAAVVGLAFKTI